MTNTNTATARELLRRTTELIPKLLDAADHLDAAETEALQGDTSPQDSPRAITAPNDEPEPPTGHTDPTGDIAISGRLNTIRNQRNTITAALVNLHRQYDHLERITTAALDNREPHTRRDTSELCAGPNCNRLKEPGSEYCAEDRAALDRIDRIEAAPTCGICDEKPVESYTTVAGTAYRGMIYDGNDWLPASSDTPKCSGCRKAGERAA